MKVLTLEEAKDQIAKKRGFNNWDLIVYMIGGNKYEKMYSEAAHLFCQSQKAQAWEEGRIANGEWKLIDTTERFFQEAVNPYLIETKKE